MQTVFQLRSSFLSDAAVHTITQLIKSLQRARFRQANDLADVFRAKVVDTTTQSFIFELTGDPTKIDSFVSLMRELGLVEVGRTGIVGMMRGLDGA